MNTIYKVAINRKAAKYLKRIDHSTRKRIIAALEGLKLRPPMGDIAPMKGMPGYYRLRVGSYRAIFYVDHNEKIIYIRTIAPRGNVY